MMLNQKIRHIFSKRSRNKRSGLKIANAIRSTIRGAFFGEILDGLTIMKPRRMRNVLSVRIPNEQLYICTSPFGVGYKPIQAIH